MFSGRMSQIGLALVGLVLGLLLGWLAIRGTDWDQVVSALSQFSPARLALALLILFASFFLRAVRWRLLWTEYKPSTFRLFLIENAALGINNISPIRAMDEALQFGILTLRDRLPGPRVAATMVLSRLMDLTFTLLFVGVAVATVPSLLRFAPAIFLTSLYFVTWIVILLNLRRIIGRFPVLRRIPGVESFEHAITNIRVDRPRMALAFLLTCTYWLMLGPLGWILATGSGIDIAPHEVMFSVIGAIFFATAVPGLPGAVGTFQFAVVSLMGLWGVGREPAITYSIVLHAVLFLPLTVLAVFVLPREGIRSIASLRSLTKEWERKG